MILLLLLLLCFATTTTTSCPVGVLFVDPLESPDALRVNFMSVVKFPNDEEFVRQWTLLEDSLDSDVYSLLRDDMILPYLTRRERWMALSGRTPNEMENWSCFVVRQVILPMSATVSDGETRLEFLRFCSRTLGCDQDVFDCAIAYSPSSSQTKQQ